MVDAETYSVETEGEPTTIEVAGRRYPVKLLSSGPDRVELEIGGERALVSGWPVGAPKPPTGVSVNGEVYRVELEVTSEVSEAPSRIAAPATSPSAPPGPPPVGAGVAVLPPMPGKILEVRVKEGDSVTAGQLLLVLEAMKMRNEVLSPAAGRVEGLRAAPGQNVRAREVLLRVA